MFGKTLAIAVHLFSGEGALVKKIQKAQQRRVAYWQLQNMTDKDLADIGISRGDIRRALYED